MFELKYLNKLRPMYFFLAFMLGIVYVFLIEPGNKYVTLHPTPENAGQIIYKNKNGEHYKYILKEINCPTDKTAINSQPITPG